MKKNRSWVLQFTVAEMGVESSLQCLYLGKVLQHVARFKWRLLAASAKPGEDSVSALNAKKVFTTVFLFLKTTVVN